MRKLIFLFIFFGALCFPDGGIFWKEISPLERADQRAFIYYDEGKETLIISLNYKGALEDFAWVIPVPSIPNVSKAPDDFFQQLNDLLEFLGVYPRHGEHWGDVEGGLGMMGGEGVEVISSQRVGIYDISVITSSDPYSLKNWLDREGYKLPLTAIPVLKPYIDKKWFFVAVKISKEAFRNEKIGEGNLSPIKIEFSTSSIVYPLRISSLNRDYLSPNIGKLDAYIGHKILFAKEWEKITERLAERIKQETGKRTPFENTHLHLLGFDELKKTYAKRLKGELNEKDFLNLVRMVIANRLLEIAEKEENRIELIVIAPYEVVLSNKLPEELRRSFIIDSKSDVKPGFFQRYLLDEKKQPLFNPQKSLSLTHFSAKIPLISLTDDLHFVKAGQYALGNVSRK
ncbi:MAG: DUF2330 domain-containing protein [bacterium]